MTKTKDEMVKEIFNLILEGDAIISKETENGLLLLGRTGAGKSTLTHLMINKSLTAKVDEITGDTIIEAENPLEDLKISHRAASETKIPNKQEYKGVTVWDCPGFKDTGGIVQEIANTFYIRRLFETTKNLKFILVMADSALLPGGTRGGGAISSIEQFSKIFKDIKFLEDKITLVVTNAPATKKAMHIRGSLDKIANENNLVQDKENVKQLIEYLKKSIHIFPKPTVEGNIASSDIFAIIQKETQYLKTDIGQINVAIEEDSIPYAKELLTTSKDTLIRLTNIFKTIIVNADKNIETNDHNAFERSFNSIKELIPKIILNINNVNCKVGSHNINHFKYLDHLAKLKTAFKDSLENNPEIIKNNLVEIFNVFIEFAQPNIKIIIEKYIHVFKQQIEFVKFLNDACSEAPVDYAFMINAINDSKNILGNMYEQQVKNIMLDPNNKDLEYYAKAIKHLDFYQEDAVCIKNKAMSFYYIASIYEQIKQPKEALTNYVKALKLDKNIGLAYEKIGDLLILLDKDYVGAVKFYKIVNHFVKIRDCYDELIKQNPHDSALRVEKADFYFEAGLYSKAHGYYLEAFSLSNNTNFKAQIWQKISDTLVVQHQQPSAKAQEYSQNATNHNFFNHNDANVTELEKHLISISGAAYDADG